MPVPLGKAIVMSCFVDADHAGCKETRQSHIGVIIYVNKAPILWYSKRQTTVETSTFGSEIVAMMRYKLRMLGVPIVGPCCSVFCDNDYVVKNVTRVKTSLRKKHCSVSYHKAREAIAAEAIRVAKESGETNNQADILTKLLPGPKLRDLSGYIMW